MQRARPSSLLFFGRSPGPLRLRATAWEYGARVVALRRGRHPARISSTELKTVGNSGMSTSGLFYSTVVASRLQNQTGLVCLSKDLTWMTSPTKIGCTEASAAQAWRAPRHSYSTGVLLQKPVLPNSGGDRQQQEQQLNVSQSPTSDADNAASRHSYALGRDARHHEGSTFSSSVPAQRQTVDRVLPAEGSAVRSEWAAGSHVQSSPQDSAHSGQAPQGYGYPPYTTQYDMRTTYHTSPPYSAYDSAVGTGASGSTYQYSGVPPEGFAPPYSAQWNGVPNAEGYTDSSAVHRPSPHYVASGGADEVLTSSHSHAFGGVPQAFSNMPPPQQELHPHMYPVAPGHSGIIPSGAAPVNLPPPQLFSPSTGVPFGSAHSSGPVPTRGGVVARYGPEAVDSSGVAGSASELFIGARPRGHLSGGGSGEERLEQLLAEIRQRLGNRANTYDAALEQDPRALLELACRPESLRRMQHSSLDWWYVLFRWQDRYHAMQLSGEIRRRNAAAAAAAASSDAGTSGGSDGSRTPGLEGTRGRGHEKGALFSFFSPEDEQAFFTFLQKMQQAFAARPLSEEAQTHGRLHDRMRCIRQLARAVSDDHRALGMGAAARKEADSLLWSLAVQEARCAANSIDILRTKGGMPMLLSILRLAETADRRRRKSATRVLVPLSSGTQDVNRASTSQTGSHKRQNDVIVQNFPGGRELKWEWISAEETQSVFDKLADAFLSCAQEANIEPCVHAVVGMGTLVEKSFLHEEKWQKVCQAMTERLKISEMVSAGSEAGLLLDSLTWMFVRNANASRRCRHVIFQVNSLLGQILRDTRSDVVARCVLGLALCRVFREENLLFYTSVLLKRQLRSDEPRKTLTPRAFCNLLVANAVAGVSAKQHLGVVVKYMLNTMATHDRAKNLSLEESARLAWAVCALQLYDPAVAGSQWPAKEAAELLNRLLSRIGRLVDGPQAAYILEALRDSHDNVAPLYPDMAFEDKYADREIRLKACSAYDQSHLGLGGTIVTVVRGALRSFGGTVKPGPERRSLLTRLRSAAGTLEESDTAPEETGRPLDETSESAQTSRLAKRVTDGVPEESPGAADVAVSAAKPAEDKEGADVIAGATKDNAGNSKRENDSSMQGTRKEVQGDTVSEENAEVAPSAASSASNNEHTPGVPNGSVATERLHEAEWIEGALLDGYPVAFYSPNLKVALDVDVCSKLPSKYMKRRHMDNHLRKNGIRHVVFCADMKRPQETLYSFLERMLKDETGALGEVGLHPTKVRAYLRSDRGSRSPRTDEAE